MDEWDWKEHFSSQPENERYLNYVADKFSLREDIQFNTTVTAAKYQEVDGFWDIFWTQRRKLLLDF